MFAFKNRRSFKVGEFLGDTRSSTSSSIEPSDEILEHLMYKLEKLVFKETKMWWDITTLEKYLAHNTVPKGLIIHKNASFISEDREFPKLWEKTLRECSFSLINLILKDRRKHLATLNTKIDELKELIIPFNDMEDFKALETEILDRIERKEDEIISKKKRKLIRDGVNKEEPDYYKDFSLEYDSYTFDKQEEAPILKPELSQMKENLHPKKKGKIYTNKKNKNHQPDCVLYKNNQQDLSDKKHHNSEQNDYRKQREPSQSDRNTKNYSGNRQNEYKRSSPYKDQSQSRELPYTRKYRAQWDNNRNYNHYPRQPYRHKEDFDQYGNNYYSYPKSQYRNANYRPQFHHNNYYPHRTNNNWRYQHYDPPRQHHNPPHQSYYPQRDEYYSETYENQYQHRPTFLGRQRREEVRYN